MNPPLVLIPLLPDVPDLLLTLRPYPLLQLVLPPLPLGILGALSPGLLSLGLLLAPVRTLLGPFLGKLVLEQPNVLLTVVEQDMILDLVILSHS